MAKDMDTDQIAATLDRMADEIVSVAKAVAPGQPKVIALLALAAAVALTCDEPAGPDIDYDQELFADAAADLEDQEAGR
jgi:hypothetical protein